MINNTNEKSIYTGLNYALNDLSILCVTRVENKRIEGLLNNLTHLKYYGAELVIIADGESAYDNLFEWYPADILTRIDSAGYIESVMDKSVGLTTKSYIFRIDDDESLSDSLLQWLIAGKYREHSHWKFPRAHLWQDTEHYITSPPLWPDEQTRLSTRPLSYGRTSIHCGSPFGGGELCPYPLLHHKFLVKTRSEREAIVARYNSVCGGMGTNFALFSVPELLSDKLTVANVVGLNT